MTDTEETVQVVVNVPRSTKETAKDKLEYGGISREVRETLERIAFGEDLNKRSRLERQAEELRDQREDLRNERRELDAEIEAIDNKLNGIQNTISKLSSEEDRYEAKLEEAEYRLRSEQVHMHPSNPTVERLASATDRSPEGVVEDLKERNPDIPNYAFEPIPVDPHPIHRPKWDGVDEEDIDLAVEDREAIHR